jgi:HD-like signal output (HDOD) protein
MPNPKCGPFDLKHLWQDSLRRGLFARSMAKLLGVKDAEAPFAAALLQDLAVPLLAKELTKRYEQILNNRNSGERLSNLERAEFGWTHADAGAVIARKWNLPEEFAQLIEHHIDLDELLADPAAEPSQLAVALSSMLPVSSDDHWADSHQFEAAYARLKGPNGPTIPELLGQIDEQFAEFAPVLDIAVPARSLVDCYHEATTVAS